VASRTWPQPLVVGGDKIWLPVKTQPCHPRIAARWLLRYLEEDPAATVEEAALAASSLIALTGAGYQEAVQTLRAMAERASRRRREQGIA
jgi:hypothetical protein